MAPKVVVGVLTVLLAGQAIALHSLSIGEQVTRPLDLNSLPERLGNWRATAHRSIEREVVEYLRPDEYIIRTYQQPDNSKAIDLFVAYFKSLQSGYGPHSPSVCLPGAGWLVQSTKTRIVRLTDRDTMSVNEFQLEKAGQRIVVLYWYQNNRRAWSDEVGGRIYMLPDLLRYRRSDSSLVRIIAPVPRNGSPAATLEYAADFARSLMPALVERFRTQ